MIEIKSQVEVTPKLLAKLFANMGNHEQAEFYNELGRLAQDWHMGLCMQMCVVRHSDRLNACGRATMAKIGEWGKEVI